MVGVTLFPLITVGGPGGSLGVDSNGLTMAGVRGLPEDRIMSLGISNLCGGGCGGSSLVLVATDCVLGMCPRKVTSLMGRNMTGVRMSNG